jgi:hypothetical protein
VKAHFDGSDYVPERDHDRLARQLKEIYAVMMRGQWRTLRELEELTGHPQASISARLRDFRKKRFGGYTVEKHYRGFGVFEYRVLAKPEQQTFEWY